MFVLIYLFLLFKPQRLIIKKIINNHRKREGTKLGARIEVGIFVCLTFFTYYSSCQFHQRFSRTFFVRIFGTKLHFSLAPKIRMKNAREKRWWNWPQMSQKILTASKMDKSGTSIINSLILPSISLNLIHVEFIMNPYFFN